MEEQKVVADASVVAKWFLEEEFSDSAQLLRDAFVTAKLTISVPSLLFYEALNALRYSGVYNGAQLALAARSLSKYGFEVWQPKGKLYEQIAKLSLEKEISVYDASYIALATSLEAILYTADLTLTQKCPQITHHISEFKPPR